MAQHGNPQQPSLHGVEAIGVRGVFGSLLAVGGIAYLYLLVCVTVLAFLLHVFVLGRWPASAA